MCTKFLEITFYFYLMKIKNIPEWWKIRERKNVQVYSLFLFKIHTFHLVRIHSFAPHSNRYDKKQKQKQKYKTHMENFECKWKCLWNWSAIYVRFSRHTKPPQTQTYTFLRIHYTSYIQIHIALRERMKMKSE